GRTGLFAFQMHTSAAELRDTFATSLRRFAIERYSELDTRFCDVEHFQKILDDTCADETFPLSVRSLDELVETYLGPVWGYSLEDDFLFLNTYKLLFDAWSASEVPITRKQIEY
ncbi:MAG TPA: hypothetical protein PLJ65_11400, partial [Casimicrobium sp.]|nr:hypothetical protein [Casimicrobium sp.]